MLVVEVTAVRPPAMGVCFVANAGSLTTSAVLVMQSSGGDAKSGGQGTEVHSGVHRRSPGGQRSPLKAEACLFNFKQNVQTLPFKCVYW